MTTTEQLAAALRRAWPPLSARRAPGLAREAERELRRWGHAGHEVSLERVGRISDEPGSLGCLFWCENCHVSQLVVLS